MKYNITVSRISCCDRTFEVDAKDEEEAETKALALAYNVSFATNETSSHYEIKEN